MLLWEWTSREVKPGADSVGLCGAHYSEFIQTGEYNNTFIQLTHENVNNQSCVCGCSSCGVHIVYISVCCLLLDGLFCCWFYAIYFMWLNNACFTRCGVLFTDLFWCLIVLTVYFYWDILRNAVVYVWYRKGVDCCWGVMLLMLLQYKLTFKAIQFVVERWDLRKCQEYFICHWFILFHFLIPCLYIPDWEVVQSRCVTSFGR